MRTTRFPELNYERHGDTWRVVDAETSRPVGPHYATEKELLADLARYAAEWGCAGTFDDLACFQRAADRMSRHGGGFARAWAAAWFAADDDNRAILTPAFSALLFKYPQYADGGDFDQNHPVETTHLLDKPDGALERDA